MTEDIPYQTQPGETVVTRAHMGCAGSEEGRHLKGDGPARRAPVRMATGPVAGELLDLLAHEKM